MFMTLWYNYSYEQILPIAFQCSSFLCNPPVDFGIHSNLVTDNSWYNVIYICSGDDC